MTEGRDTSTPFSWENRIIAWCFKYELSAPNCWFHQSAPRDTPLTTASKSSGTAHLGAPALELRSLMHSSSARLILHAADALRRPQKEAVVREWEKPLVAGWNHPGRTIAPQLRVSGRRAASKEIPLMNKTTGALIVAENLNGRSIARSLGRNGVPGLGGVPRPKSGWPVSPATPAGTLPATGAAKRGRNTCWRLPAHISTNGCCFQQR